LRHILRDLLINCLKMTALIHFTPSAATNILLIGNEQVRFDHFKSSPVGNALLLMHGCVQTHTCAIQYGRIQYNTIQYNTIQYNTIQYGRMQYAPTRTSLNICISQHIRLRIVAKLSSPATFTYQLMLSPATLSYQFILSPAAFSFQIISLYRLWHFQHRSKACRHEKSAACGRQQQQWQWQWQWQWRGERGALAALLQRNR
jgi:hypothetical protein